MEIKTLNNWMLFYSSDSWEYNRTIIQEYSSWISISEALKNEFLIYQNERPSHVKHFLDPKVKEQWVHPDDLEDFIHFTNSKIAIAYRKFLQHVKNIWEKEGYSLDITDSRKAMYFWRGNVLNTTNIFVKTYWDKIVFEVLDPDIFNDWDWRDKFSVVENYSNKSQLDWIKTFMVNLARKEVLKHQKMSLNKSL